MNLLSDTHLVDENANGEMWGGSTQITPILWRRSPHNKNLNFPSHLTVNTNGIEGIDQ